MDVFVNSPFKRIVRQEHLAWRAEQIKAGTPGVKPSREQVMRWVVTAWEKVPGIYTVDKQNIHLCLFLVATIQRGMEDLILKPALNETTPPPLVVQPVQPAAPSEVQAVNNAIQDLEQLGEVPEGTEGTETRQEEEVPVPEQRATAEEPPPPAVPVVQLPVPDKEESHPEVCLYCMRPLRASPRLPLLLQKIFPLPSQRK